MEPRLTRLFSFTFLITIAIVCTAYIHKALYPRKYFLLHVPNCGPNKLGAYCLSMHWRFLHQRCAQRFCKGLPSQKSFHIPFLILCHWLGSISYLMAAFNHVVGTYCVPPSGMFVWTNTTFRIWGYTMRMEHIACVITNSGEHKWVIPCLFQFLRAFF